MEDCV